MKITHTLFTLLFLAVPAAGFAQGSLRPPGPPAPTMKTLEQIEPRTPLVNGSPGVTLNANGGLTIGAPGSYYLTGNISVATGSGILVVASGVTIDLMGFTISSSAAAASADFIGIGQPDATALHNIAIVNGHIRGTTVYNEATKVFSGGGFRHGVSFSSNSTSIRMTDVHVEGAAGRGINLPILGQQSSIVRSCSVMVAGDMGIWAGLVEACSVIHARLTAINGQTVNGCQARSVESVGIVAKTVSHSDAVSISGRAIVADAVLNCRAQSFGGIAIEARTVSDCYAISTENIAIVAAVVSNSSGSSVENTGIKADTATNCFAYSFAVGGSLYALDVAGTASFCRAQQDAAQGITPRGIKAAVAIGCTTVGGAEINSPSKHLGTP